VSGVSGPITHTDSLSFQITDFSATTTVYRIVSPVGSNATSTLNLASLNGYQGNITLSATPSTYSIIVSSGGGAEGGRGALKFAPPQTFPTIFFSPTAVFLNGNSGSTLTFNLGSIAGNYTMTVTATDGPVTHQITFIVIATDYQITSIVGSTTLTQGTNSTLTIGLQSLNGFQGNITMSTKVNPAGPFATLNPSSLNLSISGNTAQLTIIIPSSTPPGNYTITINAVSGTILHTFTINLSVTSPGLTTILAHAIASNNILLLGIIGSISIAVVMPVKRFEQRRRIQYGIHRSKPDTINRHNSQEPIGRFTAIQPIYGEFLRENYG